METGFEMLPVESDCWGVGDLSEGCNKELLWQLGRERGGRS